jgi:hypothetical protein
MQLFLSLLLGKLKNANFRTSERLVYATQFFRIIFAEPIENAFASL